MARRTKSARVTTAAGANEALRRIRQLQGAIATRVQAFNEEHGPRYEALAEVNLPDQEEINRLEQALEAYIRKRATLDGTRSALLPAGKLALKETTTVELLSDEPQIVERLKAAGLAELVNRTEKVNRQAVRGRRLAAAELRKFGLAVVRRDSFSYRLAELESLTPVA